MTWPARPNEAPFGQTAIPARPGDPLRNDSLSAEVACVGEYNDAAFGPVIVGENAAIRTGQDLGQQLFALKKRSATLVLAIVLDQVKPNRTARIRPAVDWSWSKRDSPSGPTTTASPSMRNAPAVSVQPW